MKYDESNLPDLKLKANQISQPVTYSFWFEGYAGWANFTVNNTTGEFSIQSDWGGWHYRWHTGSLGNDRTLTQFLLTCDAGYIVRKLAVESTTDLNDEVDTEETLKSIQNRICEARRAKELTEKRARTLWNAADIFVEDEECRIENMDHDLYNFLGEPWDDIAMKKSHRFMFLVKRLIPFFQQWLKENVPDAIRTVPSQQST